MTTNRVNRREFLAGTAMSAAAALPLGASPLSTGQHPAGSHPQARPAGGRPNLVYIFADQLRYASCGYAGDE